MTFALPFDWPILYFIQEHLRTAWLDVVVPFYSSLGNGGHLWIAIALVLLFSKSYRRVGACMLVGMMAGVLLGNEWLKNLVARPRPFMLDSSVALLIPPPGQYSFPSGHTLVLYSSYLYVLWREVAGSCGHQPRDPYGAFKALSFCAFSIRRTRGSGARRPYSV